MAIKAAPKVEKAEAQAAKPKEAPIAEAPLESSAVVADKPSNAGAVYADLPTGKSALVLLCRVLWMLNMKSCDLATSFDLGLPLFEYLFKTLTEVSVFLFHLHKLSNAHLPERGSCMSESVTPFSPATKENSKLSVDELRSCHTIVFESEAAVIIGAADKSLCKRILPLLFDERDFLSYGEVKRYIIVTSNSTIFVYADKTDPSPLYIIELNGLIPKKEDSNHPEFYSHTISPEANTGLPFQNKSRESLDSVLLKRREGTKDKIAFQFAFDKVEAGESASDEFVTAVLNATKDVKV